MTVEPAAPPDRAALSELFDAYRVFYGRQSDRARTGEFIRARLASEATRFFVARERDGTLVGFVHLLPAFDTLGMTPSWILEDLFVAPEHRGRGVGAALMRRAEALARETGATRLSLSTAHDNATAQRLYLASGYRRDEHFWHFNRSVDDVGG